MTVSEKVSIEAKSLEVAFNSELNNLEWEYFESRDHQYIELRDSGVMVFDKNASPTQNRGSAFWLRNKHKEGKIHEPATVAAFVTLQKEFGHRIKTVYDIGALYGYFSVLSSSIYKNSDVVGFEMNPDSFKAFVKNEEINSQMFDRNITCANVGLSDVSSLGVPVCIDGFVLKEQSGGIEEFQEQTNVIDIFTLDSYSRLIGKSPDLIKIDVEGYQVKIVPGALETIRNSKPAIILEFDHLSRMKEMQGTNKEIADIFFDLGYKCWWIGDQRNGNDKFIELKSGDIDESKEINSLAVFIHNSWLD